MLHIAVVGYNFQLACEAIRILAENDNNTKIKRIQTGTILMEDGTKYQAFPTCNSVRGLCIDQLIIVDDCRWKVYKQQEELIDWIKYRMIYSCVPEEFLIQKFEY